MASLEKKAAHLAELIVQKSKGTVQYEKALEYSRKYYENTPFFSTFFTHAGEDWVSYEMSKRLADN